MPDKDKRTAAARAAISEPAQHDDVGPARRPVPEAVESVDPSTEMSMAPAAPDLSMPVPAGIDPLVAPLIDHLEDPKRTRLPLIRASTQEFGGDRDIVQAAGEIAAAFSQATGEAEPAALSRLQADFDLTLARVLAELGPIWLAQSRSRLKRKRKNLEGRARRRKGEARPDPALVEAAMAEERLEEAFVLSRHIADAKRAWVTAKRSEPAFRGGGATKRPRGQQPLAPQREVPAEERVPISEAAPPEQAGVAPELRGFLDLVTAKFPGFSAANYEGHGGGSFKGAGFSADVTLTRSKVGEQGFYDPTDVAAFLLALDQLAADNGVSWRALYNDAEVKRLLGGKAKHGYVQFMGQPNLGSKEMLNYHGPAPLKLHLHIDFSILMSLPPKR